MRPSEIANLDAWIERQPDYLSRPEALRALANKGLNADQEARSNAKAEAKSERDAAAAKASAEYAAALRAENDKTARLREVRLAKEARDKRLDRSAAETLLASKQGAAALTENARKKFDAANPLSPAARKARRARSEELAGSAVDQALAKIDAPQDVKAARKRKLVAPPATAASKKI